VLLDAVVERSGLPAPVREHPLPEVRGLTGFVDRWFPRRPPDRGGRRAPVARPAGAAGQGP
jgi:hypothetical protein